MRMNIAMAGRTLEAVTAFSIRFSMVGVWHRALVRAKGRLKVIAGLFFVRMSAGGCAGELFVHPKAWAMPGLADMRVVRGLGFTEGSGSVNLSRTDRLMALWPGKPLWHAHPLRASTALNGWGW